MALERSELSPRELAVTFTDEQRYFVSEASVYYSRTARTPGSDANVQQAQLARLAGSKRVNDYFTLVISTGRRNTLIFVGKMECWNELQTTDIFYRCAEVGDLGSLTARRVDEFDWP
ncbi:hypothetical protein [Parasphingorhabdus sp.]|uniref:hypothetical protein n=1 Tax=Parasphingorhabdus sp. TaxID=2709688 RepID=UPI003A5C7FDC